MGPVDKAAARLPHSADLDGSPQRDLPPLPPGVAHVAEIFRQRLLAAHKVTDIAFVQPGALLHPGQKPESNGIAEAFVKTFKRGYVRVSPIPDAATALALIDSWMEDCNTLHPHSQLGYCSLGSTSYANLPRVRFGKVNATL